MTNPTATFIEAMRTLRANQQGFDRRQVSPLEHGGVRSKTLGIALVAMAAEMGVHLDAPIYINSNGEYPLNVDTRAGTTCYGEEFATVVTQFQPRTGMVAGAHLAASNGWCWLNHFSAEKMVRERFAAHPMRPSDADEAEHDQRFEAIYARASAAMDVRGQDLAVVINLCLSDAGSVQDERRKKLLLDGHQADVLDKVEQITKDVLAGKDPVDAENPPCRPRG